MSQRDCLNGTLAKAFALAAQTASQEEATSPPPHHPGASSGPSVTLSPFFYASPDAGAPLFVPQGLCKKIQGRRFFFSR